jgi:hypothetical protein
MPYDSEEQIPVSRRDLPDSANSLELAKLKFDINIYNKVFSKNFHIVQSYERRYEDPSYILKLGTTQVFVGTAKGVYEFLTR